jgi:enoyl-CoA hydratase/carnithine racemase
VGLVAASDIVLASDRASFSLPELCLGLLPAVILPLLLERMPPQKARLLALAPALTAPRAQQLGLVDELALSPVTLQGLLHQHLKQALRTHPGAAGALKQLSEQQALLVRQEALRLGAENTTQRLSDSATRRVLKAFVDGELPPWFAHYRPQRNHG